MLKKALFLAPIILIAALAAFGSGLLSRSSAATTLDSEEQTFVNLINQYRQQNGLQPLLLDPNIQSASVWMANDMATHNYFSHTDSLGRDPFTRMCAFAYCFNTWKGENILAGASDAQTTFNWWKSSTDHNANMLGPNYTVTGIARAYGPNSGYGWYWVNDFGGYTQPGDTLASACPGDSDCDGWPDTLETYIGTNPNAACSTTTTAYDEAVDAWPPDFNDDRKVDVADVTTFSAVFNSKSGDGRYKVRWDLNGDGKINIGDVTKLRVYMGRSC